MITNFELYKESSTNKFYDIVIKKNSADELLIYYFIHLNQNGIEYALNNGASNELYKKLIEIKDWFLEQITDLEEVKLNKYSIWTKNGVVLFQRNIYSMILYVSNKYIWNVFENKLGFEYTDIKIFIEYMLKKYPFCKDFTPKEIRSLNPNVSEESLNELIKKYDNKN